MNRRQLVGAVSALLLLAGPAAATMYDSASLAAERSRIAGRLDELRAVVLRFVPAGGSDLANVRIAVPDVAPNGDPMGFMTRGDQVIMPLAGLRFIEDLTMAYAWRYEAGRSLEPMSEYLAMLRHKPLADWPGGRHLDPLDALGVPPAIWERDPSVGALGTALRNEAWAFVLAHELAHVYHRHPGNRGVSPAESQANEREADLFALTTMERSDTIPLGAILYFEATAAFYASRADAPSNAAWAQWQREDATHPVNSQRLLAMARYLVDWADRAAPQRGEVLRFIGRRLERIARDLDVPEMQQLIVRRAVHGDPRDLADR
ncbi:MAG: hypothetical protein AAFX81_06695 [Pseudomonadota bacterium]